MENLNSQIESILSKHRRAAADEIASTCFGSNVVMNGTSNGTANGAVAKTIAAAPVKSTKVSAKKPSTKKVAKTAAKAKSVKGKTAKEKAINKAKGKKRDPALLTKLMESIHKYVSSHSDEVDAKGNKGVSIEVLSKALEASSKDLTLPMKKLIKEKKITTKGQKRATRYFAK
jgi:hypothetical protein